MLVFYDDDVIASKRLCFLNETKQVQGISALNVDIQAFQKAFRSWQKRWERCVLLAKETTLKATNLNKLYLST